MESGNTNVSMVERTATIQPTCILYASIFLIHVCVCVYYVTDKRRNTFGGGGPALPMENKTPEEIRAILLGKPNAKPHDDRGHL